MNEKPRSQEPEPEVPRRELEQPDVQVYKDQSRPGVEVVVVDDHARLSALQRRTAQGLLSLYQSLAGDHPGRYAPQTLLDTVGGLSRPAFPDRAPIAPDGRKK